MDPSTIMKQGIGDKLGGVWHGITSVWRGKDTPAEQGEDVQLRFYQKMLERQNQISGEEQGLSEHIKLEGINLAAEHTVKDLTEVSGLVVTAATLVPKEAVNSVKDWAQKSEMRGLVHAYDAGMEEALPKVGGDVEKAHALVVKALEQDPYAYSDPNAAGGDFVKYGNLLQEGCGKENPHCVQHGVFWKAMKKSYEYQHPST